MSTKRRVRRHVPPGSTKTPPRPAAPVDPAARYDMREVSGHARVSRAQIYKDIAAQRLTIKKVGRRSFVMGDVLIRYLQA
jgi:hypothetical protein